MQEVKNRPIKELLQLMLDNIDFLQTGLCLLGERLWDTDLISYNEYVTLINYLLLNKPNDEDFWFPKGEKQLRINWLQKQIKKQDSFWTKIKNLWS